MAGAIVGSPVFAQAIPRFYNEGCVPASNVTAGIWIEGESEPHQAADGALIAKDDAGHLFVAQGSAVTKYSYSEASGQWEVLWQRNYYANQVNSQQYTFAPSEANPSPPIRYTSVYIEYWLSGPEQSPPRYYQPGKNGFIPPGSNILATHQYVDDGSSISTEIDERDRVFHESPFQVRVRAMTTDSSGNLYVAITSYSQRESVLVTKFAPDGDVIWREQTVPNLADGKESLAVDDIRFFELSESEDQLLLVEAADPALASSASGLARLSHRRTTFATVDDIGPGVRRVHQYGGVATAYRVASSVNPSPGWISNAPYISSNPVSITRDEAGNVFGLFLESTPGVRISSEGNPPAEVNEDRWVLRAYDSGFQPKEGKVEFLKSGRFLPRMICAAENGQVVLVGDDVHPSSGLHTAQVIRFQYSASPAPGFTRLWTSGAGKGTSARFVEKTPAGITIAGHEENLPAAWHVARFSDSGELVWKRSSPGYGSSLQRYRATGSLDALLVSPDGETHIIGSYTDYTPDFGNTLKSSVPFLSTFAADGDLQYIRLIEDSALNDPSISSTASSETVLLQGAKAFLRNGQPVIPALRRRFGVISQDQTDYQAVVLALSNPANANVAPLNITNSTRITVQSVNRSFSIPLRTNHPLTRCYGLNPDSPIVVGGSLVGSVFQPTITGTDLPYGIHTQVVVAEGGQGTSAKTFTILVKPSDVSITGHPSSVVVRKKGSVNLQVFAQGDEVRYQWQIRSESGWKNVPGARDSILNLSNVTKAASYRCRVFNRIGSEISSEVFTRTAKVSPDTEEPLISVTEPANGKSDSKSTTIKGFVFDNLEVGSLAYRVRFEDGKFSERKEVRLGKGDSSRKFSFDVETSKAGSYTIRLIAEDGSGNEKTETFELRRLR